jgi:hypothetical protein
VSRARWPARYEVRVEGVLDDRWSEWFGGLQIKNETEETTVSGTLPDQSALDGLLDHMRDLGVAVITVRLLSPEDQEGDEA